MSGQVAIIDVKGRVRIFQEEGELLGEGQIHNSRSCLNHSGKDILEIVPDKKSVSCYKLIGGELVWKMEVPSVLRQMSVPLFANRIVIRDSQNLFYYYILGKPELQDERSSYLEF